jgi:hypothetical protein
VPEYFGGLPILRLTDQNHEGANTYELHCPITAPAHMLLGHLGVVVLLLAGAALFLSLRRR